MAETLRLFVSATKDLEAERALIGRAVAELPVKIGIEIRRTPAVGAAYEDIYELIANCDRVYFLLGRDISAPSGAEWLIAWKLERAVLPLRLAGLPTPAGQDFVRLLPSGWQRFRTGDELYRLVTLDLLDILNHPKNRYGLNITELELLNLHRQRLKQVRTPRIDDPGGAEGGGVLLDLGHREPVMGVALDEE
ncbi:MAG: hypothetical protein KF832_23555 [Caldilineaceae bacterium]|nr:hypothetical protein [Caldilineaceae bacterium]